MTHKVGIKGQVVIPKAIREEIGINPGDEVAFQPDGKEAGGGLSHADAFCAATASRLGAPLWTGDPEIIERTGQLPCRLVDLRA
jgi:AbrB family looped-hinge helix DNA binding protein